MVGFSRQKVKLTLWHGLSRSVENSISAGTPGVVFALGNRISCRAQGFVLQLALVSPLCKCLGTSGVLIKDNFLENNIQVTVLTSSPSINFATD